MKKINLVITKTPLRVSYLGGGTDINYFYKNYGGSVFNCAINKYVYVTVKRHSELYDEKFRLNYSKSENTGSINKIQNRIIKECLKITKITFPIYISTISDIPTGSGLGGSSSFTVGLLKGLYALQEKKITKKKLYNIACMIEIDILKEPIGKQDQIPAVYGGLNFTKFKKNGNIVKKSIDQKKIGRNFFESSLLVWTKSTRSASKILQHQKKNININLNQLKQIKSNADFFFNIIEMKKKINMKEFGSLVNDSWKQKKNLSNKITLKNINKIIKDSLKVGCYGAKLLGAGGGGFILIFGKRKSLHKMKKLFNKLKYLNFNLSTTGSKIISIN